MLFLKNLLFTIFIPGTVSVFVPWVITRGRSLSSQPINMVLASLLFLFGFTIYLWTVWDFASLGRGTPFPADAPKNLVVKGLYHYIRNPMYVGVLLIILGWAALYSIVWLLVYALVVAIAVHIFVVLYEEPHLQELFGAEYDAYRRSVGRWIPYRPRGQD